jgi:hypothetical protein
MATKKKSNEDGEPGDIVIELMDDMKYKATDLESLVDLLNELKEKLPRGICIKYVKIIE